MLRNAPRRVLVCGGSGRMGRRVAGLVAGDPRFALAGSVARRARRGSPGVLPESALPRALERADVLVDFSSPGFSLRAARVAARLGVPCVVGTTGFGPAQERALKALARRVPILLAPNMSLGMNVLFGLAREAARRLPGYDAAVVETHHARKKDAPSGSALRLARALREGGAREPGMASLRIGDVVGEHRVLLAGPCESLELSHRAQSRDAFARGALAAALWLKGRKARLYGMEDVLGL